MLDELKRSDCSLCYTETLIFIIFLNLIKLEILTQLLNIMIVKMLAKELAKILWNDSVVEMFDHPVNRIH